MKKEIFRLLVLIVPVFIQYTSFSQGVIKAESGARIVSESGTSWVVSGGNFTLTSTNATNPATMDNLKIEAGASLQLPMATCLTVNGTLTNEAGTAGLLVRSDATGTGSLKVLGAVSGAATVERYMSPDAWHLISSPTASQPIINFLNNNTDIATAGNSYPYTFAMKNYNSFGTGWITDYFTSEKAIGDLFGTGKGYLVRTVGPEVTKIMQFEGVLNALPIGNNVPVISGWNLVGNPFTSAISINFAAGDASGGTNFIDANADVLKGSFAAIYLWDETAFPKGYIVINHSYNGSSPFYAQVGQGFFVKAVAGNLNFTSSMQVHQGAAIFKSAKVTTPQIKLIAESNAGSTSTIINFIEGTTASLDVGYDAGVFKADPSFALYTRLVEDNGVDFQLQCLPLTGYDTMVIPIGLDSKSGGEIVFSVQAVQLDQTCKVILEDKLTNTFTDLSTGSYKVTVAANTAGTGRFYLHTGDIVSGLEDQVLPGKLIAYAKSNTEIRVVGEVGNDAMATLFNGLGKVVLKKKLSAGNLNIIGLPNLSSGVYLLNIDNNGTPQTIKVMIRK